MQLKAARIAELLWERRSGDLAELGSVVASSSTAYTAGSTKKHKLGKEILEDYKTVSIGQSAYFTGVWHARALLLCQCFDLLSAKQTMSTYSFVLLRGSGTSVAFFSVTATRVSYSVALTQCSPSAVAFIKYY